MGLCLSIPRVISELPLEQNPKTKSRQSQAIHKSARTAVPSPRDAIPEGKAALTIGTSAESCGPVVSHPVCIPISKLSVSWEPPTTLPVPSKERHMTSKLSQINGEEAIDSLDKEPCRELILEPDKQGENGASRPTDKTESDPSPQVARLRQLQSEREVNLHVLPSNVPQFPRGAELRKRNSAIGRETWTALAPKHYHKIVTSVHHKLLASAFQEVQQIQSVSPRSRQFIPNTATGSADAQVASSHQDDQPTA